MKIFATTVYGALMLFVGFICGIDYGAYAEMRSKCDRIEGETKKSNGEYKCFKPTQAIELEVGK